MRPKPCCKRMRRTSTISGNVGKFSVSARALTHYSGSTAGFCTTSASSCKNGVPKYMPRDA